MRRELENGFTVIEIVIVVTILAILLGIGLPVGFDFYLDYQLDSEQELLKSILRQAENFSLINKNESSHGVFLDSDNFILFEGSNYAFRNSAEDRVFSRTRSIAISGPTELVFESLSGRTASSTYTLTNGRKNLYIYVNSEGAISH